LFIKEGLEEHATQNDLLLSHAQFLNIDAAITGDGRLSEARKGHIHGAG